ncbi:MAG: Mur ligase family protein [Gammaproteobacteria bacterium]|nr:Mur ligase family protein [Gammaproteobacteria bacterium]
MEFLDARRLTGPSLLFDGPAAILDIACTRDEADRLAPLWQANVERMQNEFGWGPCDYSRKDLTGGVSLAFTVSIDALYAASEINEWAWAACEAELSGESIADFAAAAESIRSEYSEEANPPLLVLQAAAAAKGVTFLWDDDEVSLGLGRSARTWPARELPDPASVDWDGFSDIPIGLVTGTNGKTTTVRLATHILRGAALNVGLSSTDWIAVNDRIIDRGDWSGPGGARQILRQNDVDVAILESARGGLLRRGLGVERADAALITNIAEDHLGDFGSQNLDELLDVKWIVSQAVRTNGCLILNADDPRLVAKASTFDGKLVWFSIDVDNPSVREQISTSGLAFVLDGDELLMFENGTRELICHDHEIPISLHGAARHNVANALAAAALTWSLGATLADIRIGLTTMSQDDNPGRCNVYEVQGRKVLVDFAHNPQAMRALFDMARAIPANRRVLCFGQAGDRPDDLIRAMTRDAWAIGLDRVIVSELAKYHRGREHGDVYTVIRDELLSLGAREDQVAHYEEESESLDAAFGWADSDDLVIMLALGGAAPIQEQLQSFGA